MRVALVDPCGDVACGISFGCGTSYLPFDRREAKALPEAAGSLPKRTNFHDVQDERPVPLRDLELACGPIC